MTAYLFLRNCSVGHGSYRFLTPITASYLCCRTDAPLAIVSIQVFADVVGSVVFQVSRKSIQKVTQAAKFRHSKPTHRRTKKVPATKSTTLDETMDQQQQLPAQQESSTTTSMTPLTYISSSTQCTTLVYDIGSQTQRNNNFKINDASEQDDESVQRCSLLFIVVAWWLGSIMSLFSSSSKTQHEEVELRRAMQTTTAAVGCHRPRSPTLTTASTSPVVGVAMMQNMAFQQHHIQQHAVAASTHNSSPLTATHGGSSRGSCFFSFRQFIGLALALTVGPMAVNMTASLPAAAAGTTSTRNTTTTTAMDFVRSSIRIPMEPTTSTVWNETGILFGNTHNIESLTSLPPMALTTVQATKSSAYHCSI
jgi:hypothetical protein